MLNYFWDVHLSKASQTFNNDIKSAIFAVEKQKSTEWLSL